MLFASPHYLWLLLLWPALAWWNARQNRREGDWARSLGLRVPRGRGIAGLLAVAALVLGLADLRAVDGAPEDLAGLDLMVLWDHSASMLARDGTTRFDESRQELLDLLDSGLVDRMGLIAFAGDAEVVCPLTADAVVLRDLIEARRPQRMSVGGSDVSAGIRAGLDRLSAERSAVLLVLSDGEAPGVSAPIRVPDLGRSVPIYVRCVEHADGAQLFDLVDGVREPLLDAANQPVFSQVDPRRLEELAQRHGGRRLSSLQSVDLARALAVDGVVDRHGLRARKGLWIGAWCLLLLELLMRGRR